MSVQTDTTTDLTLRQRLSQFRRSLTRQDWWSIAGMYGFIALLHVVGFVVVAAFVVPKHLGLPTSNDVPDGLYTMGVGVLAYTFGLRHAFDADHIAAIDNTTRKLLADNVAKEAAGQGKQRRPLSVGFWFSLGHSTIVVALAVLLAFGIKALAGDVTDDGSTLHNITGIIGPSVSGVFLWILGILNVAALIGIVRVWKRLREGYYNEDELEEQLNKRGLFNRFLGGLTKSVTKPWHIYPIGVLFGLGFDTATEVALLVIAGTATAAGLPWYAIISLPVLFAAGMSLMDTTDGVFMNAAYGWAFAKPIRKVFYNITITTISVIVALVIGTIELIGVLADQANINSGPIAWIANINLDYVGYGIVGLFVVSWLVAIGIWRYADIEAKWSANLAPPSLAETD